MSKITLAESIRYQKPPLAEIYFICEKRSFEDFQMHVYINKASKRCEM